MPFDSGLDKEDVAHIHDGILLGHKKRWKTAICDIWRDVENIRLSEMSDSRRPEPCDFTHMWVIKRKRLDTDNSSVATAGKRGRE